MDPRSLVPDLDPLEDRQPRLLVRAEATAVHQLLLQRRPEALHHRVVVAVAGPAHALRHAVILEEVAALPAGVLHAPVGVVHQPARRVPACDRHAQRVERHQGVQRVGHAPADDAAAPGVHHAGEVQEALVRRDVGNVAQPLPVRAGGGEVATEQVRRGTVDMAALRRRRAPLPRGFRPYSVLLHDPRHGVAVRGHAEAGKLVSDLRRAVDPARFRVDAHHRILNRKPPHLPCRDRRLQEAVVAAGTHLEQPARHAHRARTGQLVPDEGVLHGCSRAKYAAVVSTGQCNTSSGQMTPTKGGLHGIGTILAADT